MPFGLKNVGAAYHRLVNKMFKIHTNENVEVYINDIVVKSRREKDHVPDLKEVFQALNQYQMKLKPNKCTFTIRLS